jgi:hypothetical protein
MDTDSLGFSGDIDMTNAKMVWSATKYTNDTVTITPQKKIFENGTGRTFSVAGSNIYGYGLRPLSIVYDVDYSVTVSSITPATGSTISGYEPVKIVFNTSMDTASVQSGITGDLDASRVSYTWSKTNFDNDTLTIAVKDASNPLAFWPESKGKGTVLAVAGNSDFGPALTSVSASYNVENRVYVRASDGSDTDNIGTSGKPVATIQHGIALAQTAYKGSPAKVLVAAGTYEADGTVVIMADKISLYGGYLTTCWDRSTLDSTTHRYSSESVIENTCSSNPGNGEFDPACTIKMTDVGSSTILDGFSIIQGKGCNGSYYQSAVFCSGSSCPVIRNNYLPGRPESDSPGDNVYGITIYQTKISSSPLIISNNYINAGYAQISSYGIDSKTANVLIADNYINGGSGMTNSFAVQFMGTVKSGLISVSSNTIDGGAGRKGSTGYGISIYGKSYPSIIENTFVYASGGSPIYGIYDRVKDSVPYIVSGNTFNFTISDGGSYYSDFASPASSRTEIKTLDSFNETKVSTSDGTTIQQILLPDCNNKLVLIK